MSTTRRRVLLLVVVAQLLVPLVLAGLAAADLAFGRELRLRAMPVDPLDVFRGNFVALAYEISTLTAVEPVASGDRVCVRLFERNGEWRGTAVQRAPVRGDDVICGQARSAARAGEPVRIEYGIETYFASEDRARELEREIGRGRVYAVVDLDDDGSARLKRLEVD